MIPDKSNIPTEVPHALVKRHKLIEAIAKHTAQEHRAPAINQAARYSGERSGPTIRETYPELAALWQWLILKYSADQPRVPAGNRDGGQWTQGEGGGSAIASITPVSASTVPVESMPVRFVAVDTGTRADAPSTNSNIITSSDILADDPMHPVPFL